MCFGAFGWGGGFSWLGMLFGGLIMLLFWGALIALGFFAVRALTRPSADRLANGYGYGTQPRRESDAALAVLRERYARGEITRETYEQMRTDLQT